MIDCPEILDLLDDKILNFAQGYFDGKIPGISYVKVTKSYSNKLPSVDTQFFHNDLDSKNLLKLFINLNDVGPGDGATQIIKNSNIFDEKKSKLKKKPQRIMYEQLNKIQKRNIINFYSKSGDVYFANTALLHRGSKPVKKDRVIVIFSFSLHKEVNSTGDLKIDKKVYSKKDKYLKKFLRFCKKS